MDYPEIPGYIIKSRLGKGGMATIYLAEQISFGRIVALKVMFPHLSSDPSFAERFMREARNVARMAHRNFVPVYEVGQHDAHYYLSMEYLPEGDLKSHLRRGLALSDCVRITKEVASALNYAAQKNFVHRDIKPENILLREDLSAVVCDFGIAKETNDVSQMTMVGTIIGSPRYMSPEQTRATELDGRSDLYSLGIIFFEMLAGHVPFDGGSAVDIAIKHVNEPIPRLPIEMAGFQPFIDVALAKLPEDRFQTGRDMIYALEELEETQYAIIQENSVTVVMSEEDMRNSSYWQRTGSARHGSRVGTSGSAAVSSGSTTRRRKQLSAAEDGKFTGLWYKVAAVSIAAMLIVGAGWWWYLRSSAAGPVDTPATSIAMPSASFAARAQQLREKAESALNAGRLYGPGDDNAQSYLTTLLVLAPEDSDGKASITRLYGIYLERVRDAVKQRDLAGAQEILDQASQISFYIEDEALVEQQTALRRNLMDAQQQAIISAERERQIQQLLLEAKELTDAGKLTSPAGDNAYDRYQEVLSLDPSNGIASKGIEDIAGTFLEQAREQLANQQVGRASAFLAAAVQIYPQHPAIANVREAVRSEEIRLQELDSQQQAQRTQAQEAERAKRDRERKERAEKVQALLAGAAEDIKANRLSSPENNNAIDKYNQVLDLDPANVEALHGLEDVANRHIEIAMGLIEDGQLDDAEWNLARAKILSPINPKYTSAQSELIAVRDLAQQRAAAENARNEKIASLFAAAELAVKKGNIYLPRGSNALDILRQILELDSEHQPALALRNTLNKRVQADAAADIKARRFDDARLAIDALAGNNASEQDVSVLRRQLDSAEDMVEQEAARISQRDRDAREHPGQAKAVAAQTSSAVSKQQQPAPERATTVVGASEVEKSLAQASALGGPERITGANYRQLAELYQRVLRLEPRNTVADRGLSRAIDYVATEARAAILAGDYRSANELIEYLGRIMPGSPALAELRELLASRQRQGQQVAGFLAAADAITAAPYRKPGLLGNNDKTRKSLLEAFAKLQSVRAIDASNPALAMSEQRLVQKYSDIINIYLTDKNLDEVQGFLADLTGTRLGSAQVAEIQRRVNALETETEGSLDRPAVGSF
jgi:serine/threonine-protein kinase PpkA